MNIFFPRELRQSIRDDAQKIVDSLKPDLGLGEGLVVVGTRSRADAANFYLEDEVVPEEKAN